MQLIRSNQLQWIVLSIANLLLSFTNLVRSIDPPSMLSYSVIEEAERGTLIGDISTSILSTVNSGLSSPSYDKVDLTVTNWRDRIVQLFNLDSKTGHLRVAVPPDRELLCPLGARDASINPSYDSHPNGYVNSTHFASPRQLGQSVSGPEAPNFNCIVRLQLAYTLRSSIESSNNKHWPTDLQDPKLINIQIVILDINDHSPKFAQPRLSVELGESVSLINQVAIDLPTAYDPDQGFNGTLVYWLEQSVSSSINSQVDSLSSHHNTFPFKLQSSPLRLILTRPLDYELESEFRFLVVAQDMGQPQARKSSLSVHVTVRDENDNAPSFGQSTYFAVINESATRGSIVLELSASDLDGSANNQLTFSLAPPTNAQERLALQHFAIRSTAVNQAVVVVQNGFDVDNHRSESTESSSTVGSMHSDSSRARQLFTFQVVVKDNGYPHQLSSRASVEVTVLDENDWAPQVVVSYVSSSSNDQYNLPFNLGQPTIDRHVYGQLEENVPRAFIAFVNVQDRDSGNWGQVECRTDDRAFELSRVMQDVAGKVSADFYDRRGYQSLTSKRGESIGFKLLAVKPFDREQIDEISFRVICVDNPQASLLLGLSYSHPTSSGDAGIGSKQLTGTANVRVLIVDQNDNAPEFSQQRHQFAIDEASDAGSIGQPFESTLIGTLVASDRDPTAKLTYSISDQLSSTFRIDNSTGQLFAARPFDREQLVDTTDTTSPFQVTVTNDSRVFLTFPVSVSDGVHNVSTKVKLEIRDINDNAPMFEQKHYEFHVVENEHPVRSQELGRLEAVDKDIGVNAVVSYELHDDPGLLMPSRNQTRIRPSSSYFTIGSRTGQLHLIRKLDRESQSHYIFNVLATDGKRAVPASNTHWMPKKGDQTVHTATATVTIIVDDVNDNSPRITYPTSHTIIDVPAGAPAGHNLFTVLAQDPDAGENGTVRFNLTMASFGKSLKRSQEQVANSNSTTDANSSSNQTSELFAIDSSSGMVFLLEALPDQSSTHLLIISAHDLCQSCTRKTTTTVTVRNQNKQQMQSSDNLKARQPTFSSQDFNYYTNNDKWQPDQADRLTGRSDETSSDNQRSSFDYPEGSNQALQLGTFQFSDRSIVIILATIFVLLLLTTLVLICLIRRHRNLDHSHRTPVANHIKHQSTAPDYSTSNRTEPQPPVNNTIPSSLTLRSSSTSNGTNQSLNKYHPIMLHNQGAHQYESDFVFDQANQQSHEVAYHGMSSVPVYNRQDIHSFDSNYQKINQSESFGANSNGAVNSQTLGPNYAHLDDPLELIKLSNDRSGYAISTSPRRCLHNNQTTPSDNSLPIDDTIQSNKVSQNKHYQKIDMRLAPIQCTKANNGSLSSTFMTSEGSNSCFLIPIQSSPPIVTDDRQDSIDRMHLLPIANHQSDRTKLDQPRHDSSSVAIGKEVSFV